MSSTKGVIYCRVSSLEQVEGTSLESQERMCREYAEREGIEVVGVYVDKGESAKTADRPEFLKAISFCAQKVNKTEYFLVYKLDRFARNQDDHVAVRTKLKQYGVALRSVTEPIDNTSSGRLMENILSSFAEFDNSIRTERSVNGMKEKLKQGVWVWGAPIGYMREEKGGIMTASAEAVFVKIAFEEWAKEIHTYKSLATLLYENGFRSKSGKKIGFQTVQHMLKNHLYYGAIKNDQWGVDVIGQHDPLITRELFFKCQESGRKHKGTKRSLQNPEFPLRRLVVCEWCKQPLTGSASTGRGGKKHPYYHHHKQNCPHAVSIKKQELEESFVSFLEEINPTYEFANAFKEACIEIYKSNTETAEQQNQSVRQKLEKLQIKKKRVFENFEEGIYSKLEFADRKKEIDLDLNTLQEQLVTVQGGDSSFEACLDYCMEHITNTPQTWQQLAKQPDKRLRFQKSIFEGDLEYAKNTGFGTAKLSPIYSVYQQYVVDSSSLVPPLGIEPRSKG